MGGQQREVRGKRERFLFSQLGSSLVPTLSDSSSP